jgi:hypothetical protein
LIQPEQNNYGNARKKKPLVIRNMSAFANTNSRSEWAANSGKAYIATGPFQTGLYSYTVSTNSSLQMVGTLTLLTNDATKCPAGRILALNGRKLTPGANPMNLITATPGSATLTAATPKLYLGVADLVSGLNGFIDPTSVLFAPFDKNRPVSDYLVDMSAGLTSTQALTQINSGSSANILTRSAGTLDATSGTTVAGSSACGTVSMASISNTGTTNGTAIVTCSLVNSTSIILLTSRTAGCVPYVTTTGSGTFTIRVDNTSAAPVAPSVNFLVIN